MAEDGRGDGEHNGRNRLQFPVHLIVLGERPPADQVNVDILGLLEFILNHGMDEDDFGLLLELVEAHDADNNINNENHGDIGNDEDHDINNENNNNSNHEDDMNIENNGNHDNVDNLYNDDNIHNDNIDNSADNVDNENGNDDQNVGDDKLLRRSRKWSREEDDEHIEERSSKRFRWWDEFDSDSDSDSGSDSDDDITDNNRFEKDPGNSSVTQVAEEEEDPLPGPSWKYSTKPDVVKKSRRCNEFADSSDNSSDTVTARTGENLAHISSSFELDENAGAVEEMNEEVNQQVEEEGPQPKSQKKRQRESDEDSDSGSSKRLSR